jgi:hypothetical protein
MTTELLEAEAQLRALDQAHYRAYGVVVSAVARARDANLSEAERATARADMQAAERAEDMVLESWERAQAKVDEARQRASRAAGRRPAGASARPVLSGAQIAEVARAAATAVTEARRAKGKKKRQGNGRGEVTVKKRPGKPAVTESAPAARPLHDLRFHEFATAGPAALGAWFAARAGQGVQESEPDAAPPVGARILDPAAALALRKAAGGVELHALTSTEFGVVGGSMLAERYQSPVLRGRR